MTMTTKQLLHYCRVFLTLATPVLVAGCEKVVSIDLNSADPQIVVEAVISDQPGPYTVFLRKTGDYFMPAPVLPAVSGARVIVADNHGTIDTMTEVQPGMYTSAILQGLEGREYYLKIMAEGNIYEAISAMPAKVRIDSLYAERRTTGGYNIFLAHTDPPEPGNYYRINIRSGTRVPADSIDGRRYLLLNDKFLNGTQLKGRVRVGGNLRPGDTVTVELLSIDRAMYNYFGTLYDVLSSDRSPTSLSPANPVTNLSNGALGYFGAWAVDKRSIILR